MARKNKRKLSAYVRKPGFYPGRYMASERDNRRRDIARDGSAPSQCTDTMKNKAKRTRDDTLKKARQHKPSMARHKKRNWTAAGRRAADRLQKSAYNADEQDGRTPKRLDIWFADLGKHPGICVEEGIRPVVILSNDVGNAVSQLCTVAPVTSRISRLYLASHVIIENYQMELKRERSNFKAGMILLEQVTTIGKPQLLEYVGRIRSEEKAALLDASVALVLGMDPAVTG